MALKRINKELTDLGRYVLHVANIGIVHVRYDIMLERCLNTQ